LNPHQYEPPELPNKDSIRQVINNAVGGKGEHLKLVFESIERHYHEKFPSITDLCVVFKSQAQVTLEWKEMDTRVYGIFKLPGEGERSPLSCLIIQWTFDHQRSTPRVFTKWVVQEIEHLHELFQVSKNWTWQQNCNQRRNIPLPAKKWEFFHPEQYDLICGHINNTRLRGYVVQNISSFLCEPHSIHNMLDLTLLKCASKTQCNFHFKIETYESHSRAWQSMS
jgi:hypothetical protein